MNSGRLRPNLSIRSALVPGRFGIVLDAIDECGVEYVVKELSFHSKQDKALAGSEISILRQIADLRINVPRIVDSFEIEEAGRMVIVMTKEPGIPLDVYIRASKLSFCRRLVLVADIIRLLGPTCKVLDSICCHRDLNSHNILIQERPGNDPSLTIIDFGLAQEKGDWIVWRWRDSPVGGDPRYWPCCSWRVLINGWRDIVSTACGEEQYKEKLDMHSLGISLVELLVCELDDLDDDFLVEVLRITFKTYWRCSALFANLFLQGCKSGGDWNTLVQNQVVGTTRNNLRGLKSALKGLRQSYPAIHIIERMLCIDETTMTGSWTYIINKSRLMKENAIRYHY